jgi:hypothetical protein
MALHFSIGATRHGGERKSLCSDVDVFPLAKVGHWFVLMGNIIYGMAVNGDCFQCCHLLNMWWKRYI